MLPPEAQSKPINVILSQPLGKNGNAGMHAYHKVLTISDMHLIQPQSYRKTAREDARPTGTNPRMR